MSAPLPTVRLRIVFDDGAAFGPGKADLLEAIADNGSIAAAGREMGMSYQRAWSLVQEMNAMFRLPLVEATHGGARRGGAVLTGTGQAILSAYRSLETDTLARGRTNLRRLTRLRS